MKTIWIIIISTVILQSCNSTDAGPGNSEAPETGGPESYILSSVLYHQKAAEYRALCYQAFNMAKTNVDNIMRRAGLSRRQAVIVDIDETMLDNSPYEAKIILNDTSYPAYWEEWMNAKNAKPVPGALDFLKYAADQGVAIFYVTNRKQKYFDQTLENLRQFDFPYADPEHLFMRTETSSKKQRREKIMNDHFVFMLIGDNLNDFSHVFEKESVEKRFHLVDSLRTAFGNRFVVLPNAMYGDWESAIYDYERLPESKKHNIRLRALEPF